MYNNIGLQTPRGSGTSGYIMANKAKAKPQRSRLEFLKELKQLRENVLPPPRKANPDIINHMEKREIYVKLAQMRATLSAQGDLAEDEIEQQQLKQTEEELLRKFQNGELRQALAKNGKDAVKDTHALALVKEQEQNRLKSAFRVDGKYEFGSAFDFDNQEKLRLEKAYKREVSKMEQTVRKKIESAKRKAEAKLKKKKLKEKAKNDAKKKERTSSSSSSGSSSSSSSDSASGSGSSSSSGSRSSSGSSSESQEKQKRKVKKDGDKRDNLKASSGRGERHLSQDKPKGENAAKEVSKAKDQTSTNKDKSEKRRRSRSRDKGTDRKKQRSSSSRSGRR